MINRLNLGFYSHLNLKYGKQKLKNACQIHIFYGLVYLEWIFNGGTEISVSKWNESLRDLEQHEAKKLMTELSFWGDLSL